MHAKQENSPKNRIIKSLETEKDLDQYRQQLLTLSPTNNNNTSSKATSILGPRLLLSLLKIATKQQTKQWLPELLDEVCTNLNVTKKQSKNIQKILEKEATTYALCIDQHQYYEGTKIRYGVFTDALYAELNKDHQLLEQLFQQLSNVLFQKIAIEKLIPDNDTLLTYLLNTKSPILMAENHQQKRIQGTALFGWNLDEYNILKRICIVTECQAYANGARDMDSMRHYTEEPHPIIIYNLCGPVTKLLYPDVNDDDQKNQKIQELNKNNPDRYFISETLKNNTKKYAINFEEMYAYFEPILLAALIDLNQAMIRKDQQAVVTTQVPGGGAFCQSGLRGQFSAYFAAVLAKLLNIHRQQLSHITAINLISYNKINQQLTQNSATSYLLLHSLKDNPQALNVLSKPKEILTQHKIKLPSSSDKKLVTCTFQLGDFASLPGNEGNGRMFSTIKDKPPQFSKHWSNDPAVALPTTQFCVLYDATGTYDKKLAAVVPNNSKHYNWNCIAKDFDFIDLKQPKLEQILKSQDTGLKKLELPKIYSRNTSTENVYQAITQGNTDEVKKLIAKNPQQLNQHCPLKDIPYPTPLMMIIYQIVTGENDTDKKTKLSELAVTLINKYGQQLDFNQTDSKGNTLFHYAFSYNLPEIAQALITQAINQNCLSNILSHYNINNKTALTLFLEQEKLNLNILLTLPKVVKNKVDQKKLLLKNIYNKIRSSQDIYDAIEAGDTQKIKQLIEENPVLLNQHSPIENHQNTTPLLAIMYQIVHGNKDETTKKALSDLAVTLINQYADKLDFNQTDNNANTLFHYAIHHHQHSDIHKIAVPLVEQAHKQQCLSQCLNCINVHNESVVRTIRKKNFETPFFKAISQPKLKNLIDFCFQQQAVSNSHPKRKQAIDRIIKLLLGLANTSKGIQNMFGIVSLSAEKTKQALEQLKEQPQFNYQTTYTWKTSFLRKDTAAEECYQKVLKHLNSLLPQQQTTLKENIEKKYSPPSTP